MADTEEVTKDIVIDSLGYKDLESLSDIQLRFAQQVAIQRLNSNAVKRMNEIMKDKAEEVVGAMTMPPFSYVSPPIRIMAGVEAKFSTLMNDQVMDAHSKVDEFVRTENPNDVRFNQELNRLLLAHSLVEFKGEPFGDLSLPENYHELVSADPAGAKAAMSEVRDRRAELLGAMPVAIFQRLVEYYSAFQITVENITKGEDLGDLLGN